MESAVIRVQETLDLGIVIVEIRVNEPWATAIRDSGLLVGAIVPALPGAECCMMILSDEGTEYYSVLAVN